MSARLGRDQGAAAVRGADRTRADMDEHLLLSLWCGGTLKRAGMGHIGRPGNRGHTSSISLQSVQNGNLSRSCRKERQKVSMVYKGEKTLRPQASL
jgi:hypothetical protein